MSIPAVFTWMIESEEQKSRAARNGNGESELTRWRGVRADLAELELRQKRSELIEMEMVERTWQKHITDARTILQTMPDAIGLMISDDGLRSLIVPEAELIVNAALMALAEADVNPNQTESGNGAAEKD